MSFLSVLKPMLMLSEGFTPVPVWDVKQWSIGFGTWIGYDRNKKPAVTWTKERAWLEAEKIVNTHYSALKKVVKVTLNSNQWAALISFSYNLGIGTGEKMAGYINSGNLQLVKDKWLLYVIAGGVRNSGLVARRNNELKLFLSPSAVSPGLDVSLTKKEKWITISILIIILYLFI